MNKKLIITILLVLIIVPLLCGCQEQKALTSGEKSGKIKLRSSVVELHQSSFNVNTRLAYDDYTEEVYEIIENIEVKYLFKNIAGKPINIEIYAEFYDKNDILLGIGGPKSIGPIPEDYAEKGYTPQNSIIYAGSNKVDIEYVLLIVKEKV